MFLLDTLENYGIPPMFSVTIILAIVAVLTLLLLSPSTQSGHYCGDLVCSADETPEHCPRDCKSPEPGYGKRRVDRSTAMYITWDDEDVLEFMELVNGVQDRGVPPDGLELEHADADKDGKITREDFVCVVGLIDGVYDSISECPGCHADLDLEVCHDGMDNDCDGQTDMETYDNAAGVFYGSAQGSVDLCACTSITPCDMLYDIDGIVGRMNPPVDRSCSSISGFDFGDYKWYSPSERSCGDDKRDWTLICNGKSFDCINTSGIWMWWNGDYGAYV